MTAQSFFCFSFLLYFFEIIDDRTAGCAPFSYTINSCIFAAPLLSATLEFYLASALLSCRVQHLKQYGHRVIMADASDWYSFFFLAPCCSATTKIVILRYFIAHTKCPALAGGLHVALGTYWQRIKVYLKWSRPKTKCWRVKFTLLSRSHASRCSYCLYPRKDYSWCSFPLIMNAYDIMLEN